MQFESTEIIFYATLLAAGAIGCFARISRDDASVSWRSRSGWCFQSGIFGCGVCGIWMGRDPNVNIVYGPVFMVVVSALVGFYARDLEQRLLTRVFEFLIARALKLLGIEDSSKIDNQRLDSQKPQPPKIEDKSKPDGS